MKFLVRIFFILIISMLSIDGTDARSLCAHEYEDDKQIEIFDKQFSDYQNCVIKSVFEKPCLLQTVTLSVPSPSVRTINVLKKNLSWQNTNSSTKYFFIKSRVLTCDFVSEFHSLSDINIYYLFLRHIII